jgi:hypothetical protein
MTATPPPHEEFKQQIAPLTNRASQIVIVDQPSYAQASETLLGVQAWLHRIQTSFTSSKRKALELHSEICKTEHEVVDPLVGARDTLKRKMGVWVEIQMNEAEEANRRAREEREREHQEEIEERVQEAELRGATVNEVRAIIETPAMPPPPVAPAVTQVRGVSTSDKWYAEVTDKRAFVTAALGNRLLFELVEIHQPRLDRLAGQLKGALSDIPGLKIGRRAIITARRS